MTAPAKVIRDKATKQRYSKRLNGRRRTLAIRNKRLRPNNSMSDVAIVSELKLFHGAMGVVMVAEKMRYEIMRGEYQSDSGVYVKGNPGFTPSGLMSSEYYKAPACSL
ncbi:Uncharacterized protein HZ326_8623 [Fusarium oxysporum f. sp. albedinis]|nr:Uncharacterized protein HZ326_8623 [Fusarium oxysporum f. sp. albedinis]